MGTALLAVAIAAWSLPALPGAPAGPAQIPLVGFSYIPGYAGDTDPSADVGLRHLLWQLNPDLVRLPVYWDLVAPAEGRLNYAGLDHLLSEVQRYNQAGPVHHTKVVLVVGARNLAYPELHLPSWLAFSSPMPSLPALLELPAYRSYLEGVVTRYAASPLLYAWQLENEPLDSTNGALGDIAIDAALMAQETLTLRALDALHRVVVTTFNSAHLSLDRHATSPFSWLYQRLPIAQPAGHPEAALTLGDALGLDIYVVTPSTPLMEVPADERIDWKEDTLSYWAGQADQQGKQLWVTEMQAAPWQDTPGFSPDTLLRSANAYRSSGASVVLLWGVEGWLNDKTWMSAGRIAIAQLRKPFAA